MRSELAIPSGSPAARQPRERVADVRLRLIQETERPGVLIEYEPFAARNCWIYLFRQEPGRIVLAHEIRADAVGSYHAVDLARDHGKRVRPSSDAATETLRLLTHVRRHEEEIVLWYWPLVSPVQLPWSRLEPGIGRGLVVQGGDVERFERWARNRELEAVAPGLSRVELGTIVQELHAPWLQALERARLLNGALELYWRELIGGEQPELRYLHALVQTLRRPLGLDEHLDLAALEATSKHIRTDVERWARCERQAEQLVGFLRSPRYAPMIEDLTAADTDEADFWLIDHEAEVLPPLGNLKVGQSHLRDVRSARGRLLDADPKLFKNSRKVLKTYWTWVKALVAAAEHHTPDAWVPRLERWAMQHYDVRLVRAPVRNETGGLFTEESFGALKSASTSRVDAVSFFALLDLVNVACAAYEVASAKRPEDKRLKAVSLVGATTSALSSTHGLLKEVVRDPKSVVDEVKALNAIDEADRTAAQSQRLTDLTSKWERFKQMGRTPVHAKLTGNVIKLLGGIAGVVDVLTGSVGAFDSWELADRNATAFHLLTVTGGGFAIAGAVLAFSNPLTAAILAGVGSTFGMAGGIGATFATDSDFENWAKFCRWGSRRGRSITNNTAWSRGPLESLPYDLERQILCIHDLLFRLRIDAHLDRDYGGSIYVNWEMPLPHSVPYLEIIVEKEGRKTTTRPFTAWEQPHVSAIDDRRRVAHFAMPEFDAVEARVQFDLFGDQSAWYPDEPLTKRFVAHWYDR